MELLISRLVSEKKEMEKRGVAVGNGHQLKQESSSFILVSSKHENIMFFHGHKLMMYIYF